ncbi:MAG TPA: YtxH domain-containing protein [Candidatus Eisenbacteria bacterium]|nr:YtxH domain-containing protein [Candidatus Eisenbacteria bacterium]
MNDHRYDTPDIARDIARSSNSTMAFVLGTVIGAGVALLFAPATGTETRRRIRETSRRLGTNVRDGLKEGIDQTRGRIGELKQDARSAVNAGREAFNREREARATTTEQPL